MGWVAEGMKPTGALSPAKQIGQVRWTAMDSSLVPGTGQPVSAPREGGYIPGARGCQGQDGSNRGNPPVLTRWAKSPIEVARTHCRFRPFLHEPAPSATRDPRPPPRT